jgi:hypothetical protein
VRTVADVIDEEIALIFPGRVVLPQSRIPWKLSSCQNRGGLFREASKSSEGVSDYSGRCRTGDTKFRIRGWMRESKNGKRYLSLAFEQQWEQGDDF